MDKTDKDRMLDAFRERIELQIRRINARDTHEKMTYELLARKAGIPLGTLRSYLVSSVDRKMPSFYNVRNIADALGVSIDYLAGNDALPNIEHSSNRFSYSINHFLHIVMGDNPRFAFDPQKHSVSSLIPDDKEEIEFHFAFLPLEPDKEKDDLICGAIYQEGTYIFKKNNGFIRLEATLLNNSNNMEAKYIGFAVILNPNSNDGTCWGFMRLVGSDAAEFTVISFRLRRREGDRWKLKTALSIDINSNKVRPVVYRMLLSKGKVTPQIMKHFAGFLKLNIGKIEIEQSKLNIAKRFFSNIPPENVEEGLIYADLQEHFATYDKAMMLDFIKELEKQPSNILREIRTIRFNNNAAYAESNSLFKKHPTILSWLRKHGTPPDNNQLSGHLDRDIADVYNWLKVNDCLECGVSNDTNPREDI